jgi:hypothetical protein
MYGIIQLLTSDEVDLQVNGRGEYYIPEIDKSRGQLISEVKNCFVKSFQNSSNKTLIKKKNIHWKISIHSI